MPTNEAQIRQLMQHWAKAVQAKDIQSVLAHHSNDILMFDVVFPLQSRGIDLYRDSWVKDVFPWFVDDGKFELTELEITAGDTVAFCTGIINCSGTENGKKVSYKLRLTTGLKNIDGQWTVTHQHFSEPVEGAKP